MYKNGYGDFKYSDFVYTDTDSIKMNSNKQFLKWYNEKGSKK
jgi:hypothetical protein